MLDEHTQFLERVLVEQHVQSLARGQATLDVLRVDALLTAAQARLGAAGFDLVKLAVS
jgi:hypothetical protein